MFAGQTFVVIGLGKSGIGAAKLLLRRGAKVIALDENEKAVKPFEDPNFELKAGPFPKEYWKGATAVVVSPGVPEPSMLLMVPALPVSPVALVDLVAPSRLSSEPSGTLTA